MAQLPKEFELARLEALLFAAGDPLSVAQLAELTGGNKPRTWELVTALQEQYQAAGRGIMLREVAGGFQLCTKPAFARVVEQLATTQELKLSNAALETLAIIAFRQPLTRAEMEAVRGVKVDGVVNTLLDWQLITEAGRKQTVGHPILYRTTDRFLTVSAFGPWRTCRPCRNCCRKKWTVIHGSYLSWICRNRRSLPPRSRRRRRTGPGIWRRFPPRWRANPEDYKNEKDGSEWKNAYRKYWPRRVSLRGAKRKIYYGRPRQGERESGPRVRDKGR